MSLEQYTKINTIALNKLEEYCNKNEFNYERIKNMYERRKEIIIECYGRNYKNRETRIIVFAYKGIIKTLNEIQKDNEKIKKHYGFD